MALWSSATAASSALFFVFIFVSAGIFVSLNRYRVDDVNHFVIVIQISPLFGGQGVEVQFIRPLQGEDDLKQFSSLVGAPDTEFIVALLFRPRRLRVANNMFGLQRAYAVPSNMLDDAKPDAKKRKCRGG
jgi:hypothetical protein